MDIESVALAHPASYYQGLGNSVFGAIVNEVAAAVGTQQGARNFAVFADGVFQPGDRGIGQGQAPQDDSPDPGNAANFGTFFGSGGSNYAAVFGSTTAGGFFGQYAESYPGQFILHEISHTLGAVQLSASHSTGAYHCFDEWDVMCYADGGPHSALIFPCGTPFSANNEAYDCNEDDYFHPAPDPKSYLATHWNIQNSVFLCPLGRCQTADDPPVVQLTVTPSSRVLLGQPVTLSAAGSSDDAGIASYAWYLENGNNCCHLHFDTSTGTSPSFTTTFSTPGTYIASVAVTDTDGAVATWSKKPGEIDFQPITVNPPPPPPPPPPPAQPQARPPSFSPLPGYPFPTFQGGRTKGRCVVPRLRGLSVSQAKKKLRRARCRYRIRGKGRVLSTSPSAGARTNKTVLVRAKRH